MPLHAFAILVPLNLPGSLATLKGPHLVTTDAGLDRDRDLRTPAAMLL